METIKVQQQMEGTKILLLKSDSEFTAPYRKSIIVTIYA
jgi:hypothetical protein